MLKPLFAVGRRLERTLTRSEPAGATALHVSAPADFQVGDPIFISDADATAIECLGPVRGIGAEAVTVSRPLAGPRSDSAIVWTPAGALQWQVVRADPPGRSFHGGIAVERSAGGVLWSVRTGAPWREESLRFEGVMRSDFDAFRAWLDAAARGGLDDFAWVDGSARPCRVRLLDCDFTPREERPRTVDLVLRIAVLEEGSYA